MRAQGKSEISDSPVNLPVVDLGQSVLNLVSERDLGHSVLTAEHDQ
jgi:hypothetical protein